MDDYEDDGTDRDYDEDEEQEEAEEEGDEVRSEIVTLVLDMCSSIYDSGRVVNMDNYYTSPEVAVALAKRAVYIRGTCRGNRAGFPAAVQYSKGEAAKVKRVTMKMVSDCLLYTLTMPTNSHVAIAVVAETHSKEQDGVY